MVGWHLFRRFVAAYRAAAEKGPKLASRRYEVAVW
jgi:hypothetical protein